MNSIDVAELNDLVGVAVIDVREQHEYVAGHAPAAVNLPLSTLAERVDEVPRDETVYIICESGGRSAKAAEALAAQGFEVVNVTGGTAAWRDAGLPLALGD
jgi:rhodanese-related sulfurtransferase